MAAHKRYAYVLFLVYLASTSGSFVVQNNSSFGHTYETLLSRSAIECCSLCQLDDECVSVNFIPIDKTCELNSKNPADFHFTNIFSTTNKNLFYVDPALCPEQWVLYDRHCYHVQTTSRAWQASEDDCKARGAHLTDVTDYNENTFITNRFVDYSVWLGIVALHTATPQWTNIKPVSYTNYAEGEPSNSGGNEHCVAMGSSGQWNDLPCGNARLGVCKKRHY